MYDPSDYDDPAWEEDEGDEDDLVTAREYAETRECDRYHAWKDDQ